MRYQAGPIGFDWDNPEKTVVLRSYGPGWNWNDYDQMLRLTQEMFEADNIDRPVAFINIYEPGARLPKGSPLPHLNRMNRIQAHEFVVLVSQDNVAIQEVRAFVKMINWVEGRDFAFAPTVAAARERMAQHFAQKRSSPET